MHLLLFIKGQKHLIRELLDTDFQVLTGAIKATLIIPWMVLQEIDILIYRKSIDSRFKSGARFINSLLSKNHPQVKVENFSDAASGNDLYEIVPDDSILNCAIKCSKLAQVKTVRIISICLPLNLKFCNNY